MSGDTTWTSMTSNLTTLKKVQIKVEVENLHSDENLSDIDPFHSSGPKVFITRVHVGITGAIGNLPNTWDCAIGFQKMTWQVIIGGGRPRFFLFTPMVESENECRKCIFA